MFYNGDPVVPLGAANALQEFIVSFALTGVPRTSRGGSKVVLPPYGAESMLLGLNVTLSVVEDPLPNPRCTWWQEALFY
jgi:hypothetical protein